MKLQKNIELIVNSKKNIDIFINNAGIAGLNSLEFGIIQLMNGKKL